MQMPKIIPQERISQQTEYMQAEAEAQAKRAALAEKRALVAARVAMHRAGLPSPESASDLSFLQGKSVQEWMLGVASEAQRLQATPEPSTALPLP